jgi:hypothetical protein
MKSKFFFLFLLFSFLIWFFFFAVSIYKFFLLLAGKNFVNNISSFCIIADEKFSYTFDIPSTFKYYSIQTIPQWDKNYNLLLLKGAISAVAKIPKNCIIEKADNKIKIRNFPIPGNSKHQSNQKNTKSKKHETQK